MQVPEKLSLIGGSILLSSTLIFTLKSQASQILPKINDTSSKIFDHIGDAQKASDFDNSFKQAQKNGETTGQWGTAKYYIDKDMILHVGKGQLSNTVFNVISQSKSDSLKSVSFDQTVQAPQNSCGLLAQMSNVRSIDNLNNLDVSRVTDMSWMFNADYQLTGLDLSDWDTSNVNNMSWMFNNDSILQKLNISNFDTTHANTDNFIDPPWNPNNNMLNEIDLGHNTKLNSSSDIPAGDWQSGGQSINTNTINDGNSHPGNWTRQYGHATNLAPIHETDNWNGEGWEYPWSFHAEKGKTYYLSADFHHVTTNNGEFNSVQAVGGNGNAALWPHNAIPSGQSGRTITKWVANQTGNIGFGFGDDSTDKISNVAITQSDSYVPYENTTQDSNK